MSAMSQRQFFREWRRHRGLSLDGLAERIGIDKSYLSRVENGKRRYDQLFLEAVAAALDCTIPDLITRNPDDPEGLWSIYEKLTPNQRVQIVEIAKALQRSKVTA